MYGKYPRTLDDRKRIILPPKVREALGNKFYITIGMEGIVELRSEKEFNKLIDIFNMQSNFDLNARKLKRFWLGNSQEIELDSQSRFVIPKIYLDKAAIQKDALLIGVGDMVELWNNQTYENYSQQISEEELLNSAKFLVSKDDK
ncbi:division/cell wall cluster transcriptional repressor MraZ [Mycoplasmopsis meleagridis]|nr:division/cell wall cluster transcriptional repressor MraZ [Mycoplasmopsis meleagridis]